MPINVEGTARLATGRTAGAMPVDTEVLTAIVTGALEDRKAQGVTVLDVRDLTDVTDVMVVASGGPHATSRPRPNTSSNGPGPRAAGRSAWRGCARASGCSSISATSCCTS